MLLIIENYEAKTVEIAQLETFLWGFLSRGEKKRTAREGKRRKIVERVCTETRFALLNLHTDI